MNDQKHISILVLLSICSLIVIGTGCRRHSTYFDSSINVLSVNVTGDNSFYTNAWVVVGNADGSMIQEVRRIDHEGVIDFGDRGPQRISVSFVYQLPSGVSYVDCFLNTLGCEWTFVSGLPPVIGQAHITLRFPPSYYDSYSIGTPFDYSTQGQVIYADSTWSETMDIHGLEANDRFSIYASVWKSCPYRQVSGWITDQPFRRGELNEYTVNVNQPLEDRVISFSRPVNFLWIDSYRGSNNAKYNLTWGDEDPFGSTEFTVICPAFPADRFRLFGYQTDGTVTRFFDQISGGFPSSMGIPVATIAATLDFSPLRYTNITFTGSADAIVGVFVLPVDGEGASNWTVSAPPGTRSIGLPILPDSIIAALQVHTSAPFTAGCRLDDYDTIGDYDGYINLLRHADLLRRSAYTPRFSRDEAECMYNSSYKVFVSAGGLQQ